MFLRSFVYYSIINIEIFVIKASLIILTKIFLCFLRLLMMNKKANCCICLNSFELAEFVENFKVCCASPKHFICTSCLISRYKPDSVKHEPDSIKPAEPACIMCFPLEQLRTEERIKKYIDKHPEFMASCDICHKPMFRADDYQFYKQCPILEHIARYKKANFSLIARMADVFDEKYKLCSIFFEAFPHNNSVKWNVCIGCLWTHIKHLSCILCGDYSKFKKFCNSCFTVLKKKVPNLHYFSVSICPMCAFGQHFLDRDLCDEERITLRNYLSSPSTNIKGYSHHKVIHNLCDKHKSRCRDCDKPFGDGKYKPFALCSSCQKFGEKNKCACGLYSTQFSCNNEWYNISDRFLISGPKQFFCKHCAYCKCCFSNQRLANGEKCENCVNDLCIQCSGPRTWDMSKYSNEIAKKLLTEYCENCFLKKYTICCNLIYPAPFSACLYNIYCISCKGKYHDINLEYKNKLFICEVCLKMNNE